MFIPPLRVDIAPHFRRRTNLLMLGMVVVFLCLVVRLWVLQVLQGERFTDLAKNNRIRIKTIPGIRGMVFDRKGRLLIDSQPTFDLLFVPEDAKNPRTTLRYLARLLGVVEKTFLGELDRNKKRRPFREITLERDIDWRSVVAVETHATDLPGVSLKIHPRRSYLSRGVTAHLLGYLGEIGPSQLKILRHEGYKMGDVVGQFGLEKSWEKYLRGRSGGQQVEVDALGKQVRIIDQREDIPGHSIFLTVDRDLQEIAYRALRGKRGAIVVLDARNSAILGLVSTPAFDPNAFARGISAKEWKRLIQDVARPLHNKAIQGIYPPGSVFKIVLAIAALEEGIVTPETSITCHGSLDVGGRVFRDWKPTGHGKVNLHKALVESCDVYFYHIGQELGVDRIAQYARKLGLGEKTGIALDGERGGLIPDTRWKKRRFGEPWFPGETPSVSIGQGYVGVSPIQIANLMAAVANGGTLYQPWFVSKVEDIDGRLIREYGPKKIRSLHLRENTLAILRRALTDVVQSDKGTGKKARSPLALIAGKTGTAQVAAMFGAVVKSEDLPYAIRDHAWFVAYAPAERPEIVVVVLLEHGGHGSDAAPVAKELIEKYLSLKGQRAQPAGDRNKLG